MSKNISVVMSVYAPTETKKFLKNAGYNVFDGAVLSGVDPYVAHHIDMQLVKCADNQYLCAPSVYNHYIDLFEKIGCNLSTGDGEPNGEYPNDIGYNIAVTGKYAFHNFKYTDTAFLNESAYTRINVNQGYSKCNVSVVGKSAIITSDKGIAKACKNNKIDVLLVREGYIKLDGYNHGFIGGCTGLIEKNILAFVGDATTHPDYDSIKSFCLNHGVFTESLGKGDLMDVGTIISLG